jgi:hypothetical protein
MKSVDRDSPRRGSDSEHAGLNADHPRAIDRYIAYFGDRTTPRLRIEPSGDPSRSSPPGRRSPR